MLYKRVVPLKKAEPDVGQESVAEPRALRRTLHEPCNVDKLDPWVDDALGLVLVNEPVKAFVGNVDARLGDSEYVVITWQWC